MWDDWHNLLLSHPSTGHLKSNKEDSDVSKLPCHILIFQYSHENSMFWRYLLLSSSYQSKVSHAPRVTLLSIMTYLYMAETVQVQTQTEAKGL
jgi:hypothetical protein